VPFLLLIGIAALGYYVYTQYGGATDNGSSGPDNSGDAGAYAPSAVVGPDGLPVNTPDTVGFRNNNPGNLIYLSSRPFNGQIGNANGYGVYDTLSNGVRALGMQLDNYINAGLLTVAQIITRWAPPSENDTGAYISDVADRMGVNANDPLAWPGDKPDLANAIIIHENGSNPLSATDLQAYLNS
jgi:hypothetical protein